LLKYIAARETKAREHVTPSYLQNLKSLTILGVDKNMEKLELLHTIGGSINYYFTFENSW
jgi:hypothetical protein